MDPLVVTAGTRRVDELLETLERGRRVEVEAGFPRDRHRVTLRWDGRVYYCDMRTRLHAHESREEMRACIVEHGYGEPVAAEAGDSPRTG